LRLEEAADAGFEQHGLAGQWRGQEGAAGQVDAVVLVGLQPAAPQRPRCVAEHRATVELLAVALQGPEFHRVASSSRTSALPTGLRGSVPPSSVPLARSHSTVCRLPQEWLEAPAWTSSGGRSSACPIASSFLAASAGTAPGSAWMRSGIHWWWKRGRAATSCAPSPSA